LVKLLFDVDPTALFISICHLLALFKHSRMQYIWTVFGFALIILLFII